MIVCVPFATPSFMSAPPGSPFSVGGPGSEIVNCARNIRNSALGRAPPTMAQPVPDIDARQPAAMLTLWACRPVRVTRFALGSLSSGSSGLPIASQPEPLSQRWTGVPEEPKSSSMMPP